MKKIAFLLVAALFTSVWVWAFQGELTPVAIKLSGSGGRAAGQMSPIVVPLEGEGGSTGGNIFISVIAAGKLPGTTGLAAAPAGYELTVYPNPSAEQITVSACGADGYRLYNLSGAVVMSGKLGSNAETSINIAALPAQTYLFAITDEQGNTLATARVIKN